MFRGFRPVYQVFTPLLMSILAGPGCNVDLYEKSADMNYFEESFAERHFREGGPYVHLNTSHKENDMFFTDERELATIINYLSIAVFASSCRLLAFAIMSNHFHFILEGMQNKVELFWNRLKDNLTNYYKRHGKADMMNDVEARTTSINNLIQLRNEIAYVLRNPFVDRLDIHVFFDIYTSSYLYFNPMLLKKGIPASELRGRALRQFTRSRVITEVDPRIYVKDGVAQTWSFVDYKYTEKFYDNAQQFVYSVLKNVEAQIETASRHGETLYLSDDELWPVTFRISRERFHSTPKEMSNMDRKKLGVILKKEYNASNKQIARMTKLDLKEVDSLFPLSKGHRS